MVERGPGDPRRLKSPLSGTPGDFPKQNGRAPAKAAVRRLGGLARPSRRRNDLRLWLVGAVFTALAAALLFGAQPFLFRTMGAKAELLARAARLGGGAAEKAAAVGGIVKSFLDASKHVSRTEVRVEEASARRLAFSLTVPWAEESLKKQKLRGSTTARLAADLLARAGASGVDVLVEVRRREREGLGSRRVGVFLHEAASGRLLWRPAGP